MLGKLWFGVKYLLGKDIPGLEIIVRPEDTFIVAYSKSGNTWMRFLIANLIERHKPLALVDMDRIIPHCEGPMTRRDFAKMPSPRIINSHGAFNPAIKRVIYIVRDPRDVCVSLYHFQRKRMVIADDFPLDLFINRFLEGTPAIYGSWGEHVAGWLAPRQHSPGFLLLRYEDLLSDTPGELARIASFLKIKVTQEDLVAVADRCSAKRMREMEKSQGVKLAVTRKTRQDIPFVRSASSGGWRSVLSEDLVAKIESAWGPLMATLGYDLSRPKADVGNAASEHGETLRAPLTTGSR